MKTHHSFSERLYAELVRLYPKAFREEYAEEMERLFANQHEVAQAEGLSSMTSLWIRTLADFSFSVVKEHIEQSRGNMSTHTLLQFCNRNLTFSRLFAAITIILAGVCVLVTLFVLPETYMSRAKLLVRTPLANFDPDLVQTTFKNLTSRPVLEPVIDRLKLTSALAGGEAELTREEAYQRLLRMIELRERANSGVVEVAVYSGDRQLSAKIANEITTVTMQLIAASTHVEETKLNEAEREPHLISRPSPISRISWIERAAPGLKPVRPNVPLNIVVGGILSALVAVVLAAIARVALRLVTTPKPNRTGA